jgi:AcrR family transcriptional regulator
LTDLTNELEITRPSLYSAFGNKEELFRKAIARYYDERMKFLHEAMAKPTAREAVETLLYGCVDAATGKETPAGCLGLNGALACSQGNEAIRQELAQRRALDEKSIRKRLLRARAEGDLPADADCTDLTNLVVTVARGVAVQAKSGATRKELHRVVAASMRGWPS